MHRPAGRDDFGNPLPGTRHTITGCVVAPRAGTETNAGVQQQVITGLAAYLPFGADIRAADIVELTEGRWAGTRWNVVGEVGDWSSPFTGWRAGAEVALERVTG